MGEQEGMVNFTINEYYLLTQNLQKLKGKGKYTLKDAFMYDCLRPLSLDNYIIKIHVGMLWFSGDVQALDPF